MKVLITNTTLAGRTGTEILTLNLARSLLALGHSPSVYSPDLGPLATEIRNLGIPVTDDIGSLTEQPDIIHGHHSIETATAAIRFPTTPAIFVCHDFIAWHDEAPTLPNIHTYVAISKGFSQRLTHQDGIAQDRIQIIPNSIDTDRFQPGPPLAETPARALVFAKNLAHIDPIRLACAQRNIQVDVIGLAVNNVAPSPETLVGDYDLVFASGLSALESLASGRAVIACDGRGLAGMVTSENFDAFRAENFGLPVFKHPLTCDHILEQIDLYNAQDAASVSQRTRNEANLSLWAYRFATLYEDVIADFKPPAPEQTARASATFLQRWTPARSPFAVLSEREALKARIKQLQQGQHPTPLNEYIPATAAHMLCLSGFHHPEDWGAWSAEAAFSVRLRPAAPFNRLVLTGLPFISPTRQSVAIAVSINGKPVGTRLITGSRQELLFDFATVTDPVVWIECVSDSGEQPVDASGALTPRRLGFALVNLRIS